MKSQGWNRCISECMLLYKPSHWRKRLKRQRRGIGQAEVAVSTIIVGVLMVASFSTIAASRRSQFGESNKVRGIAIAEALISEIAQLPMREPSCDCGFGLETGESGANRVNFDDVDDYRGLVDTPLKSRNGTALPGYTAFTRSVLVDMVSAGDWNAVTGAYSGIYRVTVVIRVGTSEVYRLVTYRTSASSGTSSLAGFSSIN
jgi:MSHA pilin protein MshD